LIEYHYACENVNITIFYINEYLLRNPAFLKYDHMEEDQVEASLDRCCHRATAVGPTPA
jgi:hypothetical protein